MFNIFFIFSVREEEFCLIWKSLTMAMSDYSGFFKEEVRTSLKSDCSVDRRGDVGSWVRESAMYGLENISEKV